MKVELIDYTGAGTHDPAGYAAAILIFTKSTRLEMSPGLLKTIMDWSPEQKIHELTYMANTIPSSWEFCSYSFIISGVTRAFTHQLVRTRTASYAQQTMRTLDMTSGPGWKYATGPTIDDTSVGPTGTTSREAFTRKEIYQEAMMKIDSIYRELIHNGAAVEDARGILPTNILTNIVMKLNMRNFIDLVKKRSSARTQNEYRSVLDAMKEEVYRVHPWISIFMDRTADTAAKELQEKILELDLSENFDGGRAEKAELIKLLDVIRKDL
jgi:flavin-dependent thymidylate synthase